MVSDAWRYPWTLLSDYQGPGTPVEQYQKRREALGSAVTQNAVAGAERALAGDARRAREDYSPGASSPAGAAPSTASDVGYGIQRFDVRGQAPLFTNMGQAGVEDLSKKRATPLSSVERVLGGVREMPSVLNPSPATAAAQPTVFSAGGAPTFIPGDGSTGPTILGGGRGLVSPAAEDQTLSSLDSRISSLLNSNSIFDAWRARQLGRQRDRYVAGQVAQTGAQTRAFEADTGRMQVNQAPALEAARLRTMQNNAQLEAQSRKYGVDSAAGVRGKELELDAAKARPAIEMGARIKAALDKGDWATFNKLTGVTAKPGETKFEAIPPGVQYGMLTENGQTRVLNLQEMVKAQAAAAAASQEEAEARRRAGMQ